MHNCDDSPHGVEVETAYGKRRTCTGCGRKWTQIYRAFEDEPWVEERYSPMADNRKDLDD